MKLEFVVEDIPPKKDGANSMWKKETEAHRIVSLRTKALEAMKRAGMTRCMDGYIHLTIFIYLPQAKIERAGDLDNFITGICDGLQAAHPRVQPHPVFKASENKAIDPFRPLLIEDDRKVMAITAWKRKLGEHCRPYYKVLIEEIESDLG
ncbi:hypothetical protein J2S00_003754 [Caldalkalibacillus uzonensis]|uniref:Uncharacterized protein n=1 Tax=Caldalkalibacillus uzonensis TaxID=353224 RepID=A0ABU0CWW9_9BACI|nr:hypothetical protein [Caldalkalibacillus uzonensis]MDQ0340914.1 hypothetical protein [Caldalkalibacillus uzonensis]